MILNNSVGFLCTLAGKIHIFLLYIFHYAYNIPLGYNSYLYSKFVRESLNDHVHSTVTPKNEGRRRAE